MKEQNPSQFKEQVIEKYIPLVKHIAGKVMLGKTKYMEYEDLVSYGIIGLMDAINKFDKDKGMQFSSYATIRIRGAMIDEIRRHRPISKGAMEKLAKYNEALDRLNTLLQRDPTSEELAKDLGITKDDIYEIEGYINYMSVTSLDSIVYSDEDEVTIMGLIEDKDSPSPYESYEDKEKVEVLAKCIEKLKEKDRVILNLYYYENLTLKEIGQVLEISESRVCQLHSRAIKSLRTEMQKIDYI